MRQALGGDNDSLLHNFYSQIFRIPIYRGVLKNTIFIYCSETDRDIQMKFCGFQKVVIEHLFTSN